MLLENIEVLDQIQSFQEESFYRTLNGVNGLALKCKSIDVEVIDERETAKLFTNAFKNISPDIRLKFISKTTREEKDFAGLSRSDALNAFGFLKQENYLLLEMDKNPFTALLKKFSKSKNKKNETLQILTDTAAIFKTMALRVGSGDFQINPFASCTKEETENLFLDINSEIIEYQDYLIVQNKFTGLVRVKINSEQELTLESLTNIRNELTFDHEVTLTVQRLGSFMESLTLKNLKTESQSATSLLDLNRRSEVEQLEDDLLSYNKSLYSIELVFKVTAESEPELRTRTTKVARLLDKEFGSSYIESFGNFMSYRAMLPGVTARAPFNEISSGIAFYAPIFASSSFIQQDATPMSLRIHRRGGALQSINLISNYHKSGNTLIVGPKGSGKSVLTGLLTQAVLNDPNTKILKMDVGSSYARECERFNGTRFSLKLNEPSGLNPLEVFLRTKHDLEICDIVADFIEVLIAKNTEGKFGLNEEDRASLDKIVIAYSISRPQNPSLDDFHQFAKGKLPNESLIERWTEGGMFENIFKPRAEKVNLRYRYFDFESVNNASNPYLVRGSIAAVMAQYNSEVAISGKSGPRILFFCDETTEFLNHCAPFFITTVKNSRKYGHATILINQDSESFRVRDRKGEISHALFNECDHAFLFAAPKDKKDQENFKSRHELSDLDFLRVSDLKSKKGVFSEVLYKSKLGGQTLKIQLSLDEYWLLTSDKNDYDKIDALQKIGFTREEAMQCLVQLHSKLYSL